MNKSFFIYISFSCFLHANILTGLDILEKENFNILYNKDIGLVINHTSLNNKAIHILELLSNHDNIHIKSIFTPEHGLRGNFSAGEKISDVFNEELGIDIISLYGDNKEPKLSDISSLDYLIFDIQDIGSRYYTYISTLTYILNAASKAKIPVIVLDRPNPLGGEIAGPTIYPEFYSFVGMHPIPIRHGMTVGELALMINNELWLPSEKKTSLIIYEIENWNRDFGYFSLSPSPNIPNIETALLYSGMCLIEGTNLSEGRGTKTPFLLFGAPWLDVKKNLNDLNVLDLEGVSFVESNFTPVSIEGMSKYPKYQNQLCYGIKINVVDKDIVNPIKIAVSILKIVHHNHPEEFLFDNNFISKLYGSNNIIKNIMVKDSTTILFDNWKEDSDKFSKQRNPYLLY